MAMASRKTHSQVQIGIYSERSIAVPFLCCQKIMVGQNESFFKSPFLERPTKVMCHQNLKISNGDLVKDCHVSLLLIGLATFDLLPIL